MENEKQFERGFNCSIGLMNHLTTYKGELMTRFNWLKPLMPKAGLTPLTLDSATNDRDFIEGHMDPIYLLDIDGQIIDCNEKLALLLGHNKQEVLTHFAEFTLPADLDRVSNHFHRALSGHEETYTCQAIHRDGRRLTLQLTNIPAYDKHLITGVYGIARDITYEQSLETDRTQLLLERDLLSDTPGLALISFTKDGMLTDCSPALASWLGNVPKTYASFLHHVTPSDRPLLDTLWHALLTEETLEGPVSFSLTVGSNSHVLSGKMASFGDVVRGAFSDVTEQETLTRSLRERDQQLQSLYQYVDASVYERNLLTGKYAFYTHGVESLFQVTLDEINRRSLDYNERIHRNDRAKVRAAHADAESGREHRIVYRTQFEEDVKWIEERLIPQFDDSQRVISVMSVARDITRIKAQEEQIWQLAMHDSLTGLPNRSLFLHELADWIERDEQVAVLTFSFNSIHRINHDFGYAVGDDWIVATTSALLHQAPAKSFVGHLGGDEFMLLTGYTDEETLDATCASLLHLGQNYIEVGPYEWRPPVTIGISRYPHDSSIPEELLQYANTALGRTHLAGSDSVVYYASNFNIDSYRKHQLGKDLRRAIDEDELFLEFQPKVDAWSGRITGAEALVRWQHPEWGRIPPNDFIPLSEESDLHIKLADWVLDRTCVALHGWQTRNLPVVPVSINVSPKRLLHGNYTETVKRVLKRHGVMPSLLEIEILETDVLSDSVKIHETLDQLDAANIRVALDDFGTGYSSLSYLQQYPIKSIKIDQRFAADLHENKKTQGIVRTILFMAEEFAMDVVIEGVETLEQLETVRRLNCRTVQGYLFSRPLSHQAFETALEERFLATMETAGPAGVRQAFSLEANVTIHKFHDRELQIGSTPVLLTKSSLRSLHFYARVRLPITDAIELKLLLPYQGEEIPIFIRLLGITELESDLFEYEASYLHPGEAHRVVTALQHHLT